MGEADDATFSHLSESDHSSLAGKWFTIQNMVKDKFNYDLQQAEDDMPYLQRVIDEGLVDAKDWAGLKRLGVALGRALARTVDGLDWWVLEDQYGRDIVLRYRETSLQFNVLYVIGRRMSKGEKVNVRELFATLVAQAMKYRDVAE
jgi:hypothetical protein